MTVAACNVWQGYCEGIRTCNCMCPGMYDNHISGQLLLHGKLRGSQGQNEVVHGTCRL